MALPYKRLRRIGQLCFVLAYTAIAVPIDAAVVVAVGNGGTIRQSPDSGGNWFVRASGTTVALQAIDAVGSDLWTVGDVGTILHSSDSGVTWTPQVSGTVNDLFGVNFLNENEGWVVGNGGKILVTTNGGADWTPQTTDTNQRFVDIAAVSTGFAWAIQASTVRRTNDGGANWSFQTAGGQAIDAVSSSQAWLVTGNAVSRTVNGGADWTTVSVSSNELKDVDFRSSKLGWVVGDEGRVFRTIDGGVKWDSAQSVGTTATFYGISMLTNQEGWIVGALGSIRRTVNGGDNWTGQSAGTDAALWDVVAFNPPSQPDFDSDGDVDGADFLTWQRGSGLDDAQLVDGDATNDQIVDFSDLTLWERHFGSVDEELTAVPEPSSALVTLVLALTLQLLLRRIY